MGGENPEIGNNRTNGTNGTGRNNSNDSSNGSNTGSSLDSGSSKAYFIRTIIPFLMLQFSVGLCASLQATFYPIEAGKKGATASQFGAVFGIIHLSLFIFGKNYRHIGLAITYMHTIVCIHFGPIGSLAI